MRVVRSCRRGIFIITTLMVVTFIVLLVTTVTFSALQGLVNSNSFSNHELAAQAAQAGLTYIQSRLESTPTLFGQGGSMAARTSTSADGLMTVTEGGFNVAGVIQVPNVGGDNDTAMMFRATFTRSAFGYLAANPAPDSPFPIVGNCIAPGMNYVSLNNLANPNTTVSQSYQLTAGGPVVWRKLPGQQCDIIVEGCAVDYSDGALLDHRYAESTMFITGGLTVPQLALMCGGNVNLNTIPGGSGKITVNTDDNKNSEAGILALGNIAFSGYQPGGGSSPPGYSNPGGTYVASGGSGTFTYTDVSGGGVSSYSAQGSSDQPPSITSDQVPLPAASVAVPAGTWAFFDGQLYHIPLEYPLGGNNLPVTPDSQTWSTTAGGTPVLNGVAADMTMPVGSGITLPGANTLVLGNNLVATPIAAATAFTVITAPPTTYVPGCCGPVAVPYNNTITDAQIELKPPTSNSEVQLLSTGSINVLGTITGQGAVVTTGSTTVPIPADINFEAGSSLSQNNNVGLAMYSAANVNTLPLNGTSNRLPQNVLNSAGSAASLNSAIQTAINSALVQDLGTVPPVGYYTLSQTDEIAIINLSVSLGGANLNSLAGNPQAARNLVQQFLQKAGSETSAGLTVSSGQVLSTSIILVDQTFNGLIYAWNSFNQLGNTQAFQLDGSLVVYGGNPAYSPTTAGVVNMTATDITLNYSPTTLGLFSQFFGGTISLSRNTVDFF